MWESGTGEFGRADGPDREGGRRRDDTAGEKVSRKDVAAGKEADLNPLSGLSKLRKLTLTGNGIVNLEPLAGLTDLKVLILYQSRGVHDLNPLSGLKNLEILDLGGCSVDDLRPLSGLKNLKWIAVPNNNVDTGVLPKGVDIQWY